MQAVSRDGAEDRDAGGVAVGRGLTWDRSSDWRPTSERRPGTNTDRVPTRLSEIPATTQPGRPDDWATRATYRLKLDDCRRDLDPRRRSSMLRFPPLSVTHSKKRQQQSPARRDNMNGRRTSFASLHSLDTFVFGSAELRLDNPLRSDCD